MSTSITRLTPQGTFEFKGETYYKFDVELENGEAGEVNAKSADKWKLGDQVVIKDVKHSKWGKRLSLDRPGYNNSKGAPSAKESPERQESIVTQWAIREAQQYVFNGTKAPDQVTLYDIWGVAKHLKSMHDNFDTWGGIYKKQTSARATELAPENCPPVPKMAEQQMDAELAPENGINDLPF